MTTIPMARAQRMANLARANEVRSLRANVRAGFKLAGREQAALDAAHIVEAPPDYMLRVRVEELLGWLPRMSSVRTQRRRDGVGNQARWWSWAREFRFSSLTMLGQLTPTQRANLAERLRVWANREEWQRYYDRARR